MRRTWCGALDFQFDSTVDGKAIKITSMLDEHTPWGNGYIESFTNRLRKESTAA